MNGKNTRNRNREGTEKKKTLERWKAYEGDAVQVWRKSSPEKNSDHRAVEEHKRTGERSAKKLYNSHTVKLRSMTDWRPLML